MADLTTNVVAHAIPLVLFFYREVRAIGVRFSQLQEKSALAVIFLEDGFSIRRNGSC